MFKYSDFAACDDGLITTFTIMIVKYLETRVFWSIRINS